MEHGIIKRLAIQAVRRNTADARTIVLQPLDNWQPSYRAGQFITLVFDTKRGAQHRSYSICSAPQAMEPLAITVKKLDNGEFSRWLVYNARPGDILYTSGIGGFFVLPQLPGTKTYCFLAAGSGITPCFSMIKTMLLTTSQPVFLFYSNRSEAEAIFQEELMELSERFADRFVIEWLFSYKLNVYQSRLSHWLLTHLLQVHFQPAARRQLLFYVCGPFDYRLMATISLRNNGIQNEQIFKEDFDPQPPQQFPLPPDTGRYAVTMHVAGIRHVIEVGFPESIVTAAKRAGIQVPYSCEAGKCGSCVATCISGKIWMAYNEVLTDDEVTRGRVLTCQGFPLGGAAEIVY